MGPGHSEDTSTLKSSQLLLLAKANQAGVEREHTQTLTGVEAEQAHFSHTVQLGSKISNLKRCPFLPPSKSISG